MERIAIIVGKMDSGGKRNLIMNYYRHINKEKFQFDFYVDLDSNSVPEDEINKMGGRVYFLPPYQKMFKYLRELKKNFKNNKYSIVHSYLSTLDVFPLGVAKKCKIKYRISESLSMGNVHEKKNILKVILRMFSKKNANVFMSCGYDCGVWQFGKKAYNENKIHIFKTCIDTRMNDFSPELRNKTRKELGITDSERLYGFIGRFVPQKNPLFILKLFKMDLEINNSNNKLLLIGDGPLKEEMIEYITCNSLEKNVIYLGRTEDIYKYYQAMDCFLLPSLYEGLPVVGLESQCCGLPIIFSSKVTKEAKTSDIATFVDLSKSPKEWVLEINGFLNGLPERNTHAKDLIENGFDALNETRRLEDFYSNLK